MVRTEYSWMTSEELVLYVTNSKAPLPLVVELAQRLAVYIDDDKAKKDPTCPPQKAESKTQ